MKKKELKHIAPKLASIRSKGTGFITPKGYFDTVEINFFTQIYTDKFPKETGYILPENYFENLENVLVSKLELAEKSTKQSGVPRDYFDTLEDNIFARLKEESNTKVITLKKNRILIAVAASLLLFIGLYNPFTKSNTLEISEIEEWIDAGNLDLNFYEIASIYETEINDIEIQSQIDTENLEDYLNEELSESVFYE